MLPDFFTVTLNICNEVIFKYAPHVKRVATLPCEISMFGKL